VVVIIKSIWAAMHLDGIRSAGYFYVNNTIDRVVFNRFWPKPPQAERDMQTDNDDSWPEEYCRNRNASVVDENEEDEEEEDEEDEDEEEEEEEDDNEE